MLLRDLAKKTEPEHPDHAALCKCVVQMEDLASHVNESKKRAERCLVMITVQRMVKHCPPLLDHPTRGFLADFPAVLAEPADKGALVRPPETWPAALEHRADVVVYVFTDMVMVARHVRVSGVLGRSRESLRRLRGADATVRPVTVDRDGVETLHKYKFLWQTPLRRLRLVDCADPLRHLWALCVGDETLMFLSPSADEKLLLFKTVAEAQGATPATDA